MAYMHYTHSGASDRWIYSCMHWAEQLIRRILWSLHIFNGNASASGCPDRNVPTCQGLAGYKRGRRDRLAGGHVECRSRLL
jgi:hypothetical protein